MFKLKNVVVFLVILFLLAGITLQVNATDSTISLANLLTTSNTASTNTATINTVGTDDNTVNTVTTTNTAGGSIIQPEEENDTEGSSKNDLPQTGVTEDITVMFFIVVCGISAIYAYKKIRDYKA